MRRILLFPLSGYANRLQSIASTSILADQLGARMSICWETGAVVPVPATAVLSASFCAAHVIGSEDAFEQFGCTRDSVPHYLTRRGDTVLLAGYDRGEQHFMGELRQLIESGPAIDTLILAAGGRFFMTPVSEPGDNWEPGFRALRHDFYQSVRFIEEVERSADEQVREHAPYLGLHLRYTDRSHQAPFDRVVRTALRAASEQSGLVDLFVAGDTAAGRERWTVEARNLGLRPWSLGHDAWDRAQGGSERAALIDWRILGRAERLVYFAESTFAAEAAVASEGWDRSLPLAASPVKAGLVRAQEYWSAAVTYPRRHGWLPG